MSGIIKDSNIIMTRLTKCFGLILIMLGCTAVFATHYPLPADYNPKTSDLQFSERVDGTYNVYLEIPSKHIPKIWIYHSKPAAFYGAGDVYINSILIGAVFSYKDDKKYPQEIVYLNVNDHEVSTLYSDTADDKLYPKNHPLMLTPNYYNDVRYLILQPIFPNQPKVWILIKRDYSTPFPGLTGAESKFLSNGDLFLVTSADGDPQIGFTPFQPETISIDYSFFEKSVNKPTCYSLLEDHKLRPCTATEAKLRTPALKVFLGEK